MFGFLASRAYRIYMRAARKKQKAQASSSTNSIHPSPGSNPKAKLVAPKTKSHLASSRLLNLVVTINIVMAASVSN